MFEVTNLWAYLFFTRKLLHVPLFALLAWFHELERPWHCLCRQWKMSPIWWLTSPITVAPAETRKVCGSQLPPWESHYPGAQGKTSRTGQAGSADTQKHNKMKRTPRNPGWSTGGAAARSLLLQTARCAVLEKTGCCSPLCDRPAPPQCPCPQIATLGTPMAAELWGGLDRWAGGCLCAVPVLRPWANTPGGGWVSCRSLWRCCWRGACRGASYPRTLSSAHAVPSPSSSLLPSRPEARAAVLSAVRAAVAGCDRWSKRFHSHPSDLSVSDAPVPWPWSPWEAAANVWGGAGTRNLTAALVTRNKCPASWASSCVTYGFCLCVPLPAFSPAFSLPLMGHSGAVWRFVLLFTCKGRAFDEGNSKKRLPGHWQ